MNKFLGWLKNLLLPFENPAHPLYTDPGSKHQNELLDELDTWIDAELDAQDEDRIGPNYGRQPFSNPTEYERWGSKWYRKSQ